MLARPAFSSREVFIGLEIYARITSDTLFERPTSKIIDLSSNRRSSGIFTIYVEHRRRRGENVEQRRRRCVQQIVADEALHVFTNALHSSQNDIC